MESEPKLRTRLTEELEGLRSQIAELQKLAAEPAAAEATPAPAESRVVAAGAPVIQELVQLLPCPAALIGAGLRLLFPNDLLCRLLGSTAQDLESATLVELTSPESDLTAAVTRCLQEGTAGCESQLQRKTGGTVRVRMSFAALPRGDAGGSAGCIALFEELPDLQRADERQGEQLRCSLELIDSSPDGLFAFDHAAAVTLWNPAMERLFGVARADAHGKPVFEVLDALREGAVMEVLRGEAAPISRSLQPPRGGPDMLGLRVNPVRTETGEILGGIGMIRDYTDIRKAEETQKAVEERYRELFENAHDMMYTLDLEGNITSFNKAAEKLMRLARDEAVRLKLADLVAPESAELARRMLERQIAGETPSTYEMDVVARDARRLSLEISSRPIFREGRVVAIQGIARDITERKRTEAELQHANQKLEAWVSELQQRTREMTLLSEMGDMLRACLTTDEAYTVIVRVAQQIFPVHVGALYVIAPARNLVEAVALWGEASAAERVFAPDDCWALRRGRVHWVENTGVGLICRHLRHPVRHGYLCVPMMAQSEALGVLHLSETDESPISEAKQRLAVTMAEHIAMALSNLRLHETLRSQSIRDPLTGLFNRHFMEESLELELRRAARNQRPLGVLMLGIDNFKHLGNGGGKDAADTVIRETGNLLQSVVRKEDVACRLGGERFVVLLPQGGAEVTQQRAESLRDMIKRMELTYRNHAIGPLTASVGIAVFPDNGRTVETLLRATEGALHRAMEEGGDRVLAAR